VNVALPSLVRDLHSSLPTIQWTITGYTLAQAAVIPMAGWLSDRDPGWRAAVTTVSLDPFRGYATALAVHLPDAARVLDPFHVVRLGLTCVDEVRRRVQQDTTGHRGHARDPLYGIRRVLLRGYPVTRHPHRRRRPWARWP